MTTYEKKRKAAMIAVAWYLEQEKANATALVSGNELNNWSRTGIEIAMQRRQVIQSRGRLLRSA